jgi:hypothetical protein
MADAMPEPRALEERLVDLEVSVGVLTDLLAAALARSLALMHLLHEKGLLDRAEVAAWMREKSEAADTAVELGPEYETFRRWRRERDGRDVPPDDWGAWWR